MAGTANFGEVASTAGTRIVLVDRHSLTRQSISRALEGAGKDIVVLPFAGFEEVPSEQLQIDVLLYHRHERDAFSDIAEETVSAFCKRTGTPLVLLSSIHRRETILPAFQKGARGYVPVESTTLDLMLKIIRLIAAGGTFIPEISLFLNGEAAEPRPPASDELTGRERAVLSLVQRGKPNKLIAHELSMSISTVKAHIRSIMQKLKARNRTEIASLVHSGMQGKVP